MTIRLLDMFAGIGGFRSGLEAVGGFECVGHCEIDKYANQAYDAMYDTEGEVFFADARTTDPAALPDIDLICGGFPCQSFSIAGKRRGFADDARGTLFFEIAHIAAAKRPAFLLLENVPGLQSCVATLSHRQLPDVCDDPRCAGIGDPAKSKILWGEEERRSVRAFARLRAKRASAARDNEAYDVAWLKCMSWASPTHTARILEFPNPARGCILSDIDSRVYRPCPEFCKQNSGT